MRQGKGADVGTMMRQEMETDTGNEICQRNREGIGKLMRQERKIDAGDVMR